MFFWDALPDYQELTAGSDRGGYAQGFCRRGVWTCPDAISVLVRPRASAPHPVSSTCCVGHVLLCVSEVSFFFVSALATVAVFDHWKRSQFVLWKAMLLVSAIFAFFCYKRQLASVGDALLETQPEKGSNRKKPASYEQNAAAEFPSGSAGLEA